LRSRKPNSPLLWIAGLICVVAGIVVAVLTGLWIPLICGVLLTAAGVLLQYGRKQRNEQLQQQARQIQRFYAPLEPDCWVAEARHYAEVYAEYEGRLQDHRDKLRQLDTGMKALLRQAEELTDGKTISRCEQEMETALQQHKAYADALRERSRLQEMVDTLESTHRQVQAPEAPDDLTFTMPETERILSDVMAEIRQLHLRQGQCQGRMEALGSADALRQQLGQVQARISQLEKVYGAVVLAQQTLDKAKLELQRRFAPRISQRAQELFAQLTGGRYQRIGLGEDLSVSTAAEGEDTLRGSLWRSDGTADQLYLALRLAVAEELTPEAPLVLDDAFVRFDEDRLRNILNILNQTGECKQVILFTCQNRERNIMEELS
jgi:hypothetical protein